MGVQGLSKLLRSLVPLEFRECNLNDFYGEILAIDVMVDLHSMLRGRRKTWEGGWNCGGPHLRGIRDRVRMYVDAGVTPLFVFDGRPPDAKRECLKLRRNRRAKAGWDVSPVQPRHIAQVKQLLDELHMPWVVSPDEAEGLCAALYRAGIVAGVVSEDIDVVVFGGRLLHKMYRSGRRGTFFQCLDASDVHRALRINRNSFVDMCVLAGSDFCPKVKGVGPIRAYDLIARFGCIEDTIPHIDKTAIPSPFHYQQARDIFHSEYADAVAKIRDRIARANNL